MTNDPSAGIAEHNGIIWVSSSFLPTILAYRQDGSRLPTRDFTASANGDSPYLFTNSQTIWIVDLFDQMVHAYRLSDGSRQQSRDIALHADNANPGRNGRALVGRGHHVPAGRVADNTDHKLYAYSIDGEARQESREFDLDSGNNESRGIWSDGNTVWVVDRTDNKLYAYALEDGERQTSRDFNTLNAAGNSNPLRHHIGRQHHVGRGKHRQQGLLLQHAAIAPGQPGNRYRRPADNHHVGQPAAKRHHRLPVPGQQQ